ncbi:unnamed protein product [Phytophthora fragariaefolia]|uniref:Unnamed protein product n=1 Tax=Phytophthora fragariaefolia TaxID=1490495 RepID=A0A9W6X3M4_9STRA|nr:unnamed protein product [Phytophthora fragariaefolia]
MLPSFVTAASVNSVLSSFAEVSVSSSVAVGTGVTVLPSSVNGTALPARSPSSGVATSMVGPVVTVISFITLHLVASVPPCASPLSSNRLFVHLSSDGSSYYRHALFTWLHLHAAAHRVTFHGRRHRVLPARRSSSITTVTGRLGVRRVTERRDPPTLPVRRFPAASTPGCA